MKRGGLRRAGLALLSLPVYLKILGIGALVAGLFGTVAGYRFHYSAAENLYGSLRSHVRAVSALLAERLTRPLVVDDLTEVQRTIQELADRMPEVAYILVKDAEGRVAASAGPAPVTEELALRQEDSVRVLTYEDGVVVEAQEHVLEGKAGHLVLGMRDTHVLEALASMKRTFNWTLAACILLGQGLALGLAWLVTRPILHLMETSDALARGDYRKRARVFSRDEIGRLAEAFNRMAESIQSYAQEVDEKERVRRDLLDRIVGSQEEERRRIALELHDNLGQSLSLILMQVRSCRDSELPELQHRLEDLIGTLISDVRRMAFALRPSVLDDYGLDVALRQYVDAINADSTVSFDFHVSGDCSRRLPRGVELSLYRIAQEALSNVLRHSGASNASVLLMLEEDRVTLLVEDDGRGFDLSQSGHGRQTLGIAGMRERAALSGGRLDLDTSPGHGTVVRVSVPLKAKSPEQGERREGSDDSTASGR